MKKLLILASMMFVLGGCGESDKGDGVGPDDGKVSVSFSLPGIGVESSVGSGSIASVGTRTGAPVPLDEKVTVRVVAYKRTGTLADLSSDSYVDEATYIAEKESDGTIVLKPCTVTFDGTTGRISGTSTTGASPLRLMAGKYDFYAITPALELEWDSAGNCPVAPAHTTVFHGDDYASSLTEEVEVMSDGSIKQPDAVGAGGTKTQTDGKVELSVLDRKCAMLEFNVVRNTETAFDKLEIVSVTMKKMTKSPVKLCTILDEIYSGSDENGISYIADNSADFEFPASAFTKNPNEETGMDPDYPYKWRVASPILPKKEDKYNITIGIRLNDDTGTSKDAELRTPEDGTISALAFLPDKRYTFSLKLKGNGIQLVLVIGNWDQADTWEDPDGIGGYPLTSIILGTWEGVIDWKDDTDIGGFLPAPSFTNGGSWDLPDGSGNTDFD